MSGELDLLGLGDFQGLAIEEEQVQDHHHQQQNENNRATMLERATRRQQQTSDHDSSDVDDDGIFGHRKDELLRMAREDRDQFVISPSPEDDNGSEGSCSNSSGKHSSGEDEFVDPLERLPPNFAFPVTKKIIHFLNRFSSNSAGSTSSLLSSSSLMSSSSSSSNGGDEENNDGMENRSTEKVHDDSRNKQHEVINGKTSVTMSNHGQQSQGTSRGIKAAYTKLLNNLRDPRANDVLTSIKTFVAKFLSLDIKDERNLDFASLDEFSWDADLMPGDNNKEASMVQDFVKKLHGQVRCHPLWKGMNEEEWFKMIEALEKFIMLKIEKKAFQPTQRDKYLDMKLQRRIQMLSFLKPEHLEMKRVGQEFIPRWEQAGNELRNMNKFRSPRDKIVCILNCCRLITNILREEELDEFGKRLPQVGADEFVPSLIYVVLKSNPSNLHSNVEYIASYRRPSAMNGEAGYFFTQLASAISFIQRLDAGLLSISPKEFEHGLQVCKSKMDQDATFMFGWEGYDNCLEKTDESSSPNTSTHGEYYKHNDDDEDDNGDDDANRNDESLGADTAKGADIMPRQHRARTMDAFGFSMDDPSQMESWKSERFRFLNKNLGDLRVDELEQLLKEYKVLANTVEMLLYKEK